MSNCEIERKHRVGWRTVQAALTSPWPQPRKTYPKRMSKLDPFKPAIDAMLRTDLDAPHKHRHRVSDSARRRRQAQTANPHRSGSAPRAASI
jgi:hypothetical protein